MKPQYIFILNIQSLYIRLKSCFLRLLIHVLTIHCDHLEPKHANLPICLVDFTDIVATVIGRQDWHSEFDAACADNGDILRRNPLICVPGEVHGLGVFIQRSG